VRYPTRLVVAAAVLVPSVAGASVVTVSPLKDATMYSDAGDRANALGAGLFVGNTTAPFARRALISYDIAAAVPAGSTITAVSMNLRTTRAHGAATRVDMHRLLGDWGEVFAFAPDPGGAGTTAGTGDVTWTERFFGQNQSWNTPGGDFVSTVSSTQTVSTSGVTYTWASTPQLVADAQSMLDAPAANFGWILIADESVTGNAKRLASREYSTVSSRPTLTITYTVPAPGSAALLAAGGILAVRRRRSR
jgi:hypothetical protein